MSEPKELVPAGAPAEAPSDGAIMRRLPDAVAVSARNIRDGEIVFIDEKGTAMDRRRFKRSVRGWRAFLFTGATAAAVLAFSGLPIAGAMLYLGVASPFLFHQYRGSRRLLAVAKLARDGQLAEAQRRLDDAPSLRWRNQAGHASVAGSLASHRGDHEAAIRWWRQALAWTRSPAAREMTRNSLATALALHGELAEARAVRAGRQPLPAADPIFTGAIQTDLVIGLRSTDPADLPSTETLHEWASLHLSYRHTGPQVAMLAWSFERHGDEEMADFLAGEAPARMQYHYLKTWWPALQSWLDARVARLPKADPDA